MVKDLEVKRCKFYIYSNDHLPIHIHVLKGYAEAKIQFEPGILIKYNYGFNSNELRNILLIVENNIDQIKLKWHETFKK